MGPTMLSRREVICRIIVTFFCIALEDGVEVELPGRDPVNRLFRKLMGQIHNFGLCPGFLFRFIRFVLPVRCTCTGDVECKDQAKYIIRMFFQGLSIYI